VKAADGTRSTGEYDQYSFEGIPVLTSKKRKKMYNFFMSLKQPDGSFLVAHHSEVDVRYVYISSLSPATTQRKWIHFSGIYCLLVTATLLDIVTPELVEGTAGFVASCQTYEGGFSSASQPYYAPASSPGAPPVLLESPRPPLGEAHGGYTFCSLASWVILQPFLSSSSSPSEPKINKKSLLRWLAQMQGAPIELGGFKGRTNKLVDGCYSWWVGGSFTLLESLGITPAAVPAVPAEKQEGQAAKEGDWDDIDGMFSPCQWGRTHSYTTRFSHEPQDFARIHSVRRTTSCRRTAGQASEVGAVSIMIDGS
jgi:protein farnesyltransferase subunit beta